VKGACDEGVEVQASNWKEQLAVRGRSERAGEGARGGSDWLAGADSRSVLGLGCWAARKVVADGGLLGSWTCGSVAGRGLVQYTVMGSFALASALSALSAHPCA
jgi:hypothetical protein